MAQVLIDTRILVLALKDAFLDPERAEAVGAPRAKELVRQRIEEDTILTMDPHFRDCAELRIAEIENPIGEWKVEGAA